MARSGKTPSPDKSPHRRIRWPLTALALIAGLVVLQSCAPQPGIPPAKAPPAKVALTTFAQLPHWADGDPRPAFTAFRQSCTALLAKQAAKRDAMEDALAAICAEAPQRVASAAEARGFFERHFRPQAVVPEKGSRAEEGLFTGYYEPEIAASRTRHGPYQTPAYGVPDDLVRADLGSFNPALKGEQIAGRVVKGRLLPYASRAEIEAHGLSTVRPLFYVKDPVALFFLQVQGSGRLAFDDGSKARAVYAAKNGRPYTAIGRTLIEKGALKKEDVSLQTIRAWLHAHPAEAKAVMQTNESYVFFALTDTGGLAESSKGSQGVPLTPGASLAVDNRFHAYGTPLYIVGQMADGAPFDRLMIAQDSGSAIRGAVRGDIYWGIGDAAEARAGAMKMKGRMFALIPKTLAPSQSSSQ
jgi:membrane-bound lytic murein transglycosylase A